MISESAIQDIISRAFSSLGDVAGTFYIKSSVDTFDPLTSETTSIVTTVECQGVLDTSRIYYLDEQALTDAHNSLWLKSTVAPKLSDTILDSVGIEYPIVKVTAMKSNVTPYIYRVGIQL